MPVEPCAEDGVRAMDLVTATGLRPSFPEVGATRAVLLDGLDPPAGYHHLRYRRLIGRGEEAFALAAGAVRGWDMHRSAGMRVDASGPAAAGETVVSRLGPALLGLVAPCRVVWSVDEAARSGFGYATLPGHPEEGEEGFLVSLDPGDAVWVEIASFSKPGRWFTKVAGPIARSGQALFARRCASALTRATGF